MHVTGVKSEVDKNIDVQEHDVCMLPRRKLIELFTEMALLSIDASSVHSKVITRLKIRQAICNAKWVREDRQSLIAKKNWVYKLKMYIFDL